MILTLYPLLDRMDDGNQIPIASVLNYIMGYMTWMSKTALFRIQMTVFRLSKLMDKKKRPNVDRRLIQKIGSNRITSFNRSRNYRARTRP